MCKNKDQALQSLPPPFIYADDKNNTCLDYKSRQDLSITVGPRSNRTDCHAKTCQHIYILKNLLNVKKKQKTKKNNSSEERRTGRQFLLGGLAVWLISQNFPYVAGITLSCSYRSTCFILLHALSNLKKNPVPIPLLDKYMLSISDNQLSNSNSPIKFELKPFFFQILLYPGVNLASNISGAVCKPSAPHLAHWHGHCIYQGITECKLRYYYFVYSPLQSPKNTKVAVILQFSVAKNYEISGHLSTIFFFI